MKTIVIALLKGFRVAKAKLILCILAAVLSSWGISTMIYSYLMTTRDFQVNFVASNPADIVLHLDSSTPELISQLRRHPKIKDVERREALSGRIRNSNGNWMFIMLFGVEDLAAPRITKFELNERSRQTGILVENNGRNFLPDSMDSVTMQFAGNSPFQMEFAGTVYDPGQAPSQMEQALYGYVEIKSIESLLIGRSERYLVECDGDYDVVQLRAIAEELKALADKYTSTSFVIPPPGEHPHQGIVNGIAFLQESFGTIVALLGAILLSLILITWIYPQIVHIGVMKALGANSRLILGGYLIVLCSILLIGSAAGLWMGYKTAMLYDRSIAFIQNFRQIKDPFPIFIHVLTLLAVLAVPLLFVISPLIRVSRTTVHQALNHVFQTGFRKLFRLTQLITTRVARKYSFNNLFRSPQRVILLWILLATGIAIFTTGVNLRYSLKADFAKYAGDSGYRVNVVFKDSLQGKLQFLDTLPFIEKTSYVMTRTVRYRTDQQVSEESSVVRFYEPGYEMDESRVIKGELKRECYDCIYVSQRMQADFENVPLGSKLNFSFSNQTTKQFLFSGIVKDISYSGFYAFTKTGNPSYYEVAIKLPDGANSSDAVRLLDDAFLENNIDVRQIADIGTRLTALENHLAPMYLVIEVMGIATIFIGLTGLIIVLSLAIQERARETGILKALGGTNRSIILMFEFEYLIVTLFAIIGGSVFGYYFNAAICDLFGVMVINAPVTPLHDFRYLSLAAGGVLLLQGLVIYLYVRTKLSRSSRTLLADVL